jgi:hypothetical protein
VPGSFNSWDLGFIFWYAKKLIYLQCKENKMPTNFFKSDEKTLNSEYHTLVTTPTNYI